VEVQLPQILHFHSHRLTIETDVVAVKRFADFGRRSHLSVYDLGKIASRCAFLALFNRFKNKTESGVIRVRQSGSQMAGNCILLGDDLSSRHSSSVWC